MGQFQIFTSANAPAQSKDQLKAIEGKFGGQAPNFFGALAGFPTFFNAFFAWQQAAEAGSFSPAERQVVQFTVNRLNGCSYCMAAHSALFEKEFQPAVFQALRAGQPLPDARLDALRFFTEQAFFKRGALEKRDFDAFFAAGFKPEQATEVFFNIAFKTFANFFNNAAETPIDQNFQKFFENFGNFKRAA